MLLTGNQQDVLQETVKELAKARLKGIRVMPHILTKYSKDQYTHYQHKVRGRARVEVLHNTQHPRLIYNNSKVNYPILSIDVEMQVKLIDHIRAIFDKNLALDDENVKAQLQLALEDAFWNWMLNGNVDGDQFGEGILNLTGVSEVPAEAVTDSTTAKQLATDLIDAIDNAGGDDSLAYTILMPKKYQNFYQDFMLPSNSIFLENWLAEKKSAVLLFDKDFTVPTAFQASSGNVGFHRSTYGYYDVEKEAGTRAHNHLMTMFGAGLVVANRKQVARAEFV